MGFYNNYNFIIKNANTDTQKSEDFKEDKNYYLSGIFQFNSSLPLIKEDENYQNILKPKLALKLAPNGSNDLRNKDVRIDADNAYSLNRIGTSDSIKEAHVNFG